MDICKRSLWCVDQDFTKGKIGEFYNIGSGININNNLIAKNLLGIAKKISLGKNVKIKYVTDRPGHDIRYALNSKKIYKQLGWKAKLKFLRFKKHLIGT